MPRFSNALFYCSCNAHDEPPIHNLGLTCIFNASCGLKPDLIGGLPYSFPLSGLIRPK